MHRVARIMLRHPYDGFRSGTPAAVIAPELPVPLQDEAAVHEIYGGGARADRCGERLATAGVAVVELVPKALRVASSTRRRNECLIHVAEPSYWTGETATLTAALHSCQELD